MFTDLNKLDSRQASVQHDIINLSIQELAELNDYYLAKRKEILKQHTRDITQLASGKYAGYYQTFIYQDNKRKVLRAKTKEELENKLIGFYTDESSKNKPTVNMCFEGWIEDLKILRKESSIHTYRKTYKRFFETWEDKYIEEITAHDIKLFVKKAVADYKLTSKAYSSLKTVLFGVFHYAQDVYKYPEDIDYIAHSLSREMRGAFAPSKRINKTDEEEIFSKKEEKKIIEFCQDSGTLVDAGIELLFYTGLRIGELAALRKEAISPDHRSIFINATEERISNKAEYIIVDSSKTEAGIREVLLTPPAVSLIEKILNMSYKGSEFLFSDSKINRYSTKKFRDRVYRICSKLNIPKRSPHAIRRTYASSLVEADVSENLIIKQMGHTDIEITKKFYVYNRKSRDALIAELGSVM